jgi:regulator of nucleoside diphosphate kinase
MEHVRKNLPDIVVSKDNQKRISDLALVVENTAPDVASVLLSEMDRARVVEGVPATTVQMGSSIKFRTNAGQERKVTLVYPGDADIAENKVSILTPIGAALIGLSAGQSDYMVRPRRPSANSHGAGRRASDDAGRRAATTEPVEAVSSRHRS